jgi:hypothetical protein
LRDADGQCLVCHVHAPVAELLERLSDCTAGQRTTNRVSDRLLSKT